MANVLSLQESPAQYSETIEKKLLVTTYKFTFPCVSKQNIACFEGICRVHWETSHMDTRQFEILMPRAQSPREINTFLTTISCRKIPSI
jgi:hypothetical protein